MTAVCESDSGALSHAISMLSQVRTFEYGAVHVAIREGMLGDGLGAKVWSTAHFMAK